jgi:hypothetical protein
MKTFWKTIFTKLTGVLFEFFWEKKFSPNLQEKPLSAYTEYSRNDRSFSNIGPMKKFFLENSN